MSVLKWMDKHLEEVLLVILSTVMVIVVAAQVFMRFVMGSSLVWSEELARYCFIWLIYIGISYGVKKQRHIKVDVVLLLFKDKGKIVMSVVANLIFLAFAIFAIKYGYSLVDKILTFGQTSPGLRIPMGFVYLATPIGMALTSIRLIQQLILQVRALLGKEEFEVQTEAERVLNEKAEIISNEPEKV